MTELARKADAERLAEQQDEAVLAADEASRAHDAQVTAAEWEVGRLQQLNSDTRQLLKDAEAASDPAVTAAKGRQAAVTLLGSGGTWVRDAAEEALSGTDEDVAEFVRTRLSVAMEQDDRASVAHIATTTEIPAQRQAALDVVDHPVDQVREFLRTRAYPGKDDDDRVAVAKVAAKGGPGVKAAASEALDGTAADVARFLQTGQFEAQEDDDRVAVTEALAGGGPEVKAAAQAVLSGPPSGLRPFLEVGLYKARQRDANAAAHLAEVSTLLQSAYKSAWLAQKDAAEAQKVAAQARKDAAKAVEWSNKAQHSSEQANTYAVQADKSADQAAKSAESAAQSAKTARAAAASARQDAQSATRSAESAQHSAGVAGDYAYEANTAAYEAGQSAEAAGKDAASAAKASSEAMKSAADKLVAELKEQVKQELQQASKPVTDEELRKALEKRLVMYRGDLLRNGELKPGETLLVCGGDGAGGMGCITSTYLDRLIAWYVGADEIEDCLQNTKPSCFSGLALAALKLKVLRKLPCQKNSFTPGTPVLLGDGRTKAIEDIRVGEKVLATDPVSGRTQAEPVQATITGQGEKSLVKVTVSAYGPGATATVTATDGHPFWVANAHAWRDAGDLRPGMELRTAAGTPARVTAVKSWTVPDQRVHNLTVAKFHTYYVFAGATPVLVHNAKVKCSLVIDHVGQVDQDWVTKGAHVNLKDGMEVALRPDGKGGITGEAIRLRKGTATTKQVQATVDAIKSDPKVREDMIRVTKAAKEVFESSAKAMKEGRNPQWRFSYDRSAELQALIEAMEKM
ncbi:polymorphic toxin-type HINT domain-containing protein [Streptomyces mirabilis]|uniref:polymorphic toxin-type HINT domain-containing protein n=1 Tax=Streptomyces mirabilis TaxID=68239 RepID=UPI00338EE410